MDLYNKILDIISNIKYEPKTLEEFEVILNNSDDSNDFKYELDDIKNELDKLVAEYKLFINKKNKYLNNHNANKYVGKISIKNGHYGFVSNPYYEDFYVDSYYFEEAMDKDLVLYTVEKFKTGNYIEYEARVIKVIKRYYEFLVGEIKYENGRTILDTNEKSLTKRVYVSKLGHSKVGDIVRTKIIDYGYNLKVDVLDVLGNSHTLGIDITSIVVKNNIPYIFPDEVIEESKNLYNKAVDTNININNDNKYEYIEDLIFTIDGDDAKDLDDAISVKKLTNGNFELGVFIADVSNYVEEGSKIDLEAYKRGTSIYLVDRVIPMLPVRLSNDLCSLNPNENKLVLALTMEVDKYGNVIDSVLKEGIIKTTKRLSYSKCNDVLENGLINNPDYEVCYETLKIAKELSEILTIKRDKRGAINFDVDEPKIIVDEKGKAIDIEIRERGVSERIIEEFMILANETVAEMIYNFDLPFIYRVHEDPDIIKFHMLKQMVSKLGYSIQSLHPKEIQKLLDDLTDEDSFLKTSILRMMNKAVYSERNIGHFGLASRCYTHFTSPIRRYPDLLVHRLLRKYIIHSDNLLTDEEHNNLNSKINLIAKETSDSERRAIDCEYKVLDMKKAEYMEKYIGETYEGIVTSVLKFGVFVTLPNTVDGLIRGKDLNDFGFKYNENYYLNTRTNEKIGLGSKVKVKLVSINKKIGEINFELVYNNSNKLKDKYFRSKGNYFNTKKNTYSKNKNNKKRNSKKY